MMTPMQAARRFRGALAALALLVACGDDGTANGEGASSTGGSDGSSTTAVEGSSSTADATSEVDPSSTTAVDPASSTGAVDDVPREITEPTIEPCGSIDPHPPPEYDIYGDRYGEVWGVVIDGREYAVLTHTYGLSVVDVEEEPLVEVGHLELPGYVPGRAVQGFGHYAYVGGQGPEPGQPILRIVDVSDPTQPKVVAEREEYHNRIHTLQVHEGILYLNSGYGTCRFLALDDPADPVQIGAYQGNDCHDILAVGDRLFVAGGFTEHWDIVDIADPTNPQVLGVTAPEEGIYAHSGALDQSGKFYFGFDEFHVHDMLVYDVSDPGAPTLVTTFGLGPEVPHNGQVRGSYLYTAWYEAGFVLIDVHDPTAPFEALRYPTWPDPPRSEWNGAIALDMHLPSGKVLVTDAREGLFCFSVQTPP